MYGRHFETMYTGSMVGAGAMVFAVWGYVIANMKPDKEVGAQVRLNPKLLETILGEAESDIAVAICRLCAPDPRSVTKREGGRRLVKVSEFDYLVVNGSAYMAIRNAEELRRYNRTQQAKHRALKRSKGSVGEGLATRAMENGDQRGADAITSESLPEACRASGLVDNAAGG